MTRRPSQNSQKRSTRRNGSEQAETSRESRRQTARSSRSGRSAQDSRSGRSSQSQKSNTREERRQKTSSYDGRKQRSAANDNRKQKSTAREERKRQRTKARADKMFDRQVAIAQSREHQAEPEGAPRAALYEGKMGSKHRKSARMQRVSEAGPVSAKINPAGWFSNIPLSPRTLKVATAVLCVALVAVFLYVPAQQYYQAQREHDRLVAEYSVVEERNSAIDFENDSLASNAGMEDAVREKYGYIVAGEETAIVTGLSEDTLENIHGASDVEGNVLSSSVKAPEEWYTPFLDAFFGVE